MDARWTEVKAVVAAALDTPVAERGAYLDGACGDNADLRREVESLLMAAEGGDSLPEARAAVAAARASYALDAESLLRASIEQTLGDRYEIIRPLGSGGMGAVFLARERALDRLVAIKVLRPDLAEAAEGRERFRREARIAANLSHPGILPLHTFGESGGIWYFVMGYLRGQSLADRLRLEGRLSSADARRILAELADALDWAHRHGVVHRDIKPSNILLDDESGRAILADFGISKLTGGSDSLTITGLVVGSPQYMSPEQAIASGDVDERSDLYSLGAVGYTMLVGREPFAGATANELMLHRLTQDPIPLTAVAPDVPADLASVVTRCLARDPALRWPTAHELRDAVVRAGDDQASTLPEGVRDLPSFAPYAVAWAVAWSALALVALPSPRDRVLLLLVALLVPVGFVLHVWNTRRDGLRPLDLARIASWPPEWWGVWWPRALRRPTDIWARLPWQARFVRLALTAFFVGLPALILAREWLSLRGGESSIGEGVDAFAAAEIALVLGTALVVTGGFWWTSRHGLSVSEGARVLFGATLPAPIWNAPQVATLLDPHTGGVRLPDRHTPADHRRAIHEVAALLGADAASAGSAARQLADLVCREIERCDRDAAAFARDASPHEIERLTVQLGMLDESPDRDGADRRELRDLVSHQLDVIRRMQTRREVAEQRSAHLFYLLRGLWAQLCVLRNIAASEPAAVARQSDHVRELCSEMSRALETDGAVTSGAQPEARG
jgi:serine/threonine-protein kinase